MKLRVNNIQSTPTQTCLPLAAKPPITHSLVPSAPILGCGFLVAKRTILLITTPYPSECGAHIPRTLLDIPSHAKPCTPIQDTSRILVAVLIIPCRCYPIPGFSPRLKLFPEPSQVQLHFLEVQ